MIVYREASTLAKDLGVPIKTLYALSNSLPAHYRTVLIPRQGGGRRQLTVPDEALKHIQRSIARNLLAHMPVSAYAMAYRPGGSAVRNAARHTGRREVLRLDIRHFFDSVLYSAVKETVFPPEIFSESLRILLTMLCYYRDALPQGAPTSPAIANILLREFDLRIAAWCREREIFYTRYCDDLVFSGSRGLAGVQSMAEAELRTLGFSLHGGKTLLRTAGQRQTVTGLVVNRQIGVPVEYRRALRQAVYYCRRFGVESHLERAASPLTPDACLEQLLGRVGYVLQVSPDCAWAKADRQWLLEERRRRLS